MTLNFEAISAGQLDLLCASVSSDDYVVLYSFYLILFCIFWFWESSLLLHLLPSLYFLALLRCIHLDTLLYVLLLVVLYMDHIKVVGFSFCGHQFHNLLAMGCLD